MQTGLGISHCKVHLYPGEETLVTDPSGPFHRDTGSGLGHRVPWVGLSGGSGVETRARLLELSPSCSRVPSSVMLGR